MSLGRSVSAASMLGPTKVNITINIKFIKMIVSINLTNLKMIISINLTNIRMIIMLFLYHQVVSITIKLTNIKMMNIMLFLYFQVVRRVDRPRPLKLSAANRLPEFL